MLYLPAPLLADVIRRFASWAEWVHGRLPLPGEADPEPVGSAVKRHREARQRQWRKGEAGALRVG